ncbi:MAG: nucleotidyltransferase family protein [Oscillospiraceae bacterium]|nr:nucleotidyltransferase family protein [Oscillospiraceae bacterium]
MNDSIETIAENVLTQYPVKRAAFFGSAARGDMSMQSDIDMLVEFLPGSRGLDFFGLRADLEEAFGCHVDLITWNALSKSKPGFKKAVESEARLIYGY